jgi:hypothetical protein
VLCETDVSVPASNGCAVSKIKMLELMSASVPRLPLGASDLLAGVKDTRILIQQHTWTARAAPTTGLPLIRLKNLIA